MIKLQFICIIYHIINNNSSSCSFIPQTINKKGLKIFQIEKLIPLNITREHLLQANLLITQEIVSLLLSPSPILVDKQGNLQNNAL